MRQILFGLSLGLALSSSVWGAEDFQGRPESSYGYSSVNSRELVSSIDPHSDHVVAFVKWQTVNLSDFLGIMGLYIYKKAKALDLSLDQLLDLNFHKFFQNFPPSWLGQKTLPESQDFWQELEMNIALTILGGDFSVHSNEKTLRRYSNVVKSISDSQLELVLVKLVKLWGEKDKNDRLLELLKQIQVCYGISQGPTKVSQKKKQEELSANYNSWVVMGTKYIKEIMIEIKGRKKDKSMMPQWEDPELPSTFRDQNKFEIVWYLEPHVTKTFVRCILDYKARKKNKVSSIN